MLTQIHSSFHKLNCEYRKHGICFLWFLKVNRSATIHEGYWVCCYCCCLSKTMVINILEFQKYGFWNVFKTYCILIYLLVQNSPFVYLITIPKTEKKKIKFYFAKWYHTGFRHYHEPIDCFCNAGHHQV
jgi:hypothetical protein